MSAECWPILVTIYRLGYCKNSKTCFNLHIGEMSHPVFGEY